MTPEQKAAHVSTQATDMLSEAESMHAENQNRITKGLSTAYTREDFLGLIDRYGLGKNALIEFFRS